MNPPLKFVAIAFNDYGGIGFEFYYSAQAVVRLYFEGLRDEKEEEGQEAGVRTGTHASRSRSSCRESASR